MVRGSGIGVRQQVKRSWCLILFVFLRATMTYENEVRDLLNTLIRVESTADQSKGCRRFICLFLIDEVSPESIQILGGLPEAHNPSHHELRRNLQEYR